jgi:hypothetical protein
VTTRKFVTVCLAVLISLGSGLVAMQSASAAGPVITVLDRTPRSVDFGQVLGTCSASPGGKCAIYKTVRATRQVDVALGVSRRLVSAQLDIPSARSRSVTVRCEATMSTKYSLVKAYPTGTEISYRITSGGETSGTLTAFDPNPTSRACFTYR